MKKILTAVLALVLVASMTTCALAATGLGSVTTVTATAAGEKNGSVQVVSTMCAVSLDEEGKIASVTFDVVQPSVSFDTTGAIVGEVAPEVQSKCELGEAYGMKSISPIGKEYYEQVDALEAWCIGKTVEEVLAAASEDGHIADDVDVKASCTIGVSELFQALEEAASLAK